MLEILMALGGIAAGACLACWRLRDRASSAASFAANLRAVILRTGGQGEER